MKVTLYNIEGDLIMGNKQNVENCIKTVFSFAKNKIIEQAKTELSGSEKKVNVDEAVTAFVKQNIKTENPIIGMLINILIEYIPVITQCIYEYLRKYIDGLTKV